MSKQFNALKTGVHARTTLLPWEDRDEFEQRREDIFADLCPQGVLQNGVVEDIVHNLWVLERTREFTAIFVHRHAFGRKIEEAARSWDDVLSFLRKRDVARDEVFKRIDATILQVAKVAGRLTKGSAEPEKEANALHELFSKIYEQLAGLNTSIKEEREFLLDFPRHLQDCVRIENSLFSQYDKLRARLINEKEARLYHAKLEAEIAAKALPTLDARRASINEKPDAAPVEESVEVVADEAPIAASVEGQFPRGRSRSGPGIDPKPPRDAEKDPLDAFVEGDVSELGRDDV